MKVKNIVFSGFAAAILMGIAADASAATQVATKAYVDSLDNVLLAPTGSVVSGVTQEDGKVMSLTTTEFDTEIPEENPSNTTAPTTKAVYDFVTANDTTYTAGSHIAIDNNAIAVDDITSEAAGITDTSTALTTGKAVYEYVDELTGGVLPQGCENGNCALVKLNGRLQWVDLTTPLQ